MLVLLVPRSEDLTDPELIEIITFASWKYKRDAVVRATNGFFTMHRDKTVPCARCTDFRCDSCGKWREAVQNMLLYGLLPYLRPTAFGVTCSSDKNHPPARNRS